MKKYIVLFLLVTSSGFTQNLKDYKYALVPSKFSFLSDVNMYNLNLLTKMYLQKYGFETYFDNETAPDDFVNMNCNKIFVDLIPNNNIFTTKVKVILKDCKGTILFTSQEGTSGEKEYKVAYNQALRMAFDNFSVLKTHKFQPAEKSLGMIGEPNEIKVTTELKVALDNGTIVNTTNNSSVLLAQPISNGFQLINNEPKVIYKIYKTSTKDYYIATKGTINGIFFSRTNEWFFEYYQNEKLISEKVEVKF
jgi:hypothetical protein